ncbi:NAD(+) diphosphatase [Kistimonas scapharcae]
MNWGITLPPELTSRIASESLDRRQLTVKDAGKPEYAIVFSGRELLLNEQGAMYWSCGTQGVPSAFSQETIVQHYVLGSDSQAVFHAVEIAGAAPDLQPEDLRSAMGLAAESDAEPLAMAASLLGWGRKTQYCAACGGTLVAISEERYKACSQCQAHYYPPVSPCVIVLVSKGNEILLARSPRHKPGMFTLLAGFVEPGETVEQALAREVYEESGVRVKNIRYIASQPWPFAHNLMLGYHAEFESGDLVLDRDELEAGDWFHIDQLPELPPRFTLSRQLIETYIAKIKPVS